MTEEWLSVVGCEDRYEVSSFGRCRSLRFRTKSGDFARSEPLTLKLFTNGTRPYLRVSISGTLRLVHQLVLEAFVGPRPPGHEASHRDGNPVNNRLENLEWLPRLINYAERRPARGEGNGWSKLTAEIVHSMREAHGRGIAIRAIARWYGVSQRAAQKVVHRETWRDEDYVPAARQARGEG